jgi:hypothetical protein
VDFKHSCSEFDTNGDYCDRCNSAFSADGFCQLLESSQGFLHHDLAHSREERTTDAHSVERYLAASKVVVCIAGIFERILCRWFFGFKLGQRATA